MRVATVLKAAGVCLLVVWMAYVTLRVEHAHRMAHAACAYAFAAARGRDASGRISWNDSDCPWWIGDFGWHWEPDGPGPGLGPEPKGQR